MVVNKKKSATKKCYLISASPAKKVLCLKCLCLVTEFCTWLARNRQPTVLRMFWSSLRKTKDVWDVISPCCVTACCAAKINICHVYNFTCTFLLLNCGLKSSCYGHIGWCIWGIFSLRRSLKRFRSRNVFLLRNSNVSMSDGALINLVCMFTVTASEHRSAVFDQFHHTSAQRAVFQPKLG